jgi:hypothetical protein
MDVLRVQRKGRNYKDLPGAELSVFQTKSSLVLLVGVESITIDFESFV